MLFRCRNSYVNGEEGKANYLAAFLHLEWARMPISARKQHSAINCLKCVQVPSFALKQVNTTFTTNALTPRINIRRQQETTPDIAVLSKATKRNIIKTTQQMQKKQCLPSDMAALFGGATSIRGWDAQRMRQFGVHEKHTPHSHTGTHDLAYRYDRDVIVQHLTGIADENLNLGAKMHRKWTELGREAGLQSRTGAKTIPTTQVNISYEMRNMFSQNCIFECWHAWL